jgi:hypothetical protein
MGIAMGILTGDWRGEEDSGAAVVERVQLQHLQTDLCADDNGYDLSDRITAGSLRACRPSTVVRRKIVGFTCLTSNGYQSRRAADDNGIPRSSDSRPSSKMSVSSLVQRYPGSIALHSPSPSRCRDELVWSRTGRQDGRRRSTNKKFMKHNISQRRATPRVPEVDDRNNEAVAEAAGSKRGPRQQHNLIETSCILHMQSSSFCRRNNAVMLQWRRLMLPFAEENSIFSGSPVLSDCRVLLGGIFLQSSPSPPLMIGEFAVM